MQVGLVTYTRSRPPPSPEVALIAHLRHELDAAKDRIRQLETQAEQPRVLSLGDVELDPVLKVVRVAGQETLRVFGRRPCRAIMALEALMSRPGGLWRTDRLLCRIGLEGAEEHNLYVAIFRARRAIKTSENVWIPSTRARGGHYCIELRSE